MAEIEITIVENVVSSFELLELIMSCVCVFVFLCGCVFPNSEVFGNMIFFFFFAYVNGIPEQVLVEKWD